MELLAMGKYGFYVWTSFALTGFVLVACVVQAKRWHRKVLHDIARQQQIMETEQ